jgi:hypothetical protein
MTKGTPQIRSNGGEAGAISSPAQEALRAGLAGSNIT